MIKNIVLQALVVVIVFNLVSFLRETQLLGYQTAAPQFELVSLNGETVNNKDLMGKPTLVYFWAPWCSVCNVSLPNLQDFYVDYGAKVNVVSVALSFDDLEDVHMMVLKHKLDFPVLVGSQQIAEKFKITGFPTYYLFDEEQQVVGKSLGYTSEMGMKLRALTL